MSARIRSRRRRSQILRRTSARTPRETVMAGMREPLEPIAATGPILALDCSNRRQDRVDRDAVLSGTGGDVDRKAGLVAAGGVLGALAASSCCIVPLVLFALGISGAWIGNLTALTPYQPIFIGVTLAFLATGYYLVYHKPAAACREGEACPRPLPRRGAKLALWIATALVMSAIAFPYIARALLPP